MMKPAHDSAVDYKKLVQAGYDACADAYTAVRQDASHPELACLFSNLQEGVQVLDIGCGGGVPVAKMLSTRFHVTGVDISSEQIRLARQHVPGGTFLHADIMQIDFAPCFFDAVVAFYSIFHLPQEEHPDLFRRIYRWLKPRGYLLAMVSSEHAEAYTEDDFFGVNMYWSYLGLVDYIELCQTTGFTIIESTMLGHGYTQSDGHAEEHHPLIVAQKVEEKGTICADRDTSSF